MSDEAIQEDVSSFGADRLAKLKAIADSRNEEREEDEQDGFEALSERAEQLNEELAQAEAELNGEYEEPEEDEGEEEEPEEQQEKYKLKVNGQEKEMTFDQIIAIAQKQEAADARLQEAARRFQELEQREREFEARASSRQPSAQDVDSQKSSQELKELAQQYHEALLDGDDERANELFVEIQSGRQAPTQFNPDEIAQRVYQTVEQKNAEKARLAEIRSAQELFANEYSDIDQDPELRDWADRITAKLAQEDPSLSPTQLVTAAGDLVRSKIGASARNQRVERKQRTGAMTGTNAKRSGKPPVKPKTRIDTLNEMRLARGASAIY